MSLILVIGGNSDIGYASAKIFAKNKFSHYPLKNFSPCTNIRFYLNDFAFDF